MFSAKTKLVTSFKPTGVSNISISLIAAPCIFAFSTPVSYLIPVSGLTRDRSGAELYPLPPSVISISVISFLSTTVMFGDIKTSGFNVLSAEKSNPWSLIVNSFILPTVSDTGIISALIPLVDAILTNSGNFL